MKKKFNSYLSFILILSISLIISNYAFIKENNTDNSLSVSSVSKEKIVYLTFDDGPSENTSKILEILNKYEIPATFFVTGPSYKLKNNLLNEIIQEGHSIQIHSYNHIYSQIYNSYDDYLNDFLLCLNWIKEITNTSPYLYRFPGGSSNTIANKQLIKDIILSLEKKGYKHVDWNVDSLDSKYNKDSKEIINSTIKDIKKNEKKNTYNQIILFHDNQKKVGTIDALPSIIEYCLSNGYIFKLLSNHSLLIQHVKKP